MDLPVDSDPFGLAGLYSIVCANVGLIEKLYAFLLCLICVALVFWCDPPQVR